MNEKKLNVAAICALLKMTTDQLADAIGCSRSHLMNVRTGRVRITSDDLLGISQVSGIDVHLIETDPQKQ